VTSAMWNERTLSSSSGLQRATEDRVSHLAGELVRLNVDVLVTYGPAVPAVQRATSTIPIVMATYGDAVATGLIASLANPGGNLTGLTVSAGAIIPH
jgi:putative tryptophan/tyrosine transport system substrate-binding protein